MGEIPILGQPSGAERAALEALQRQNRADSREFIDIRDENGSSQRVPVNQFIAATLNGMAGLVQEMAAQVQAILAGMDAMAYDLRTLTRDGNPPPEVPQSLDHE